jgi:creatinine amidohydrolase/Fe(II)-dependent formamide hydrolase-like protein
MGYPSRATREKGERLWTALIRRVLDDVKRQLG